MDEAEKYYNKMLQTISSEISTLREDQQRQPQKPEEDALTLVERLTYGFESSRSHASGRSLSQDYSSFLLSYSSLDFDDDNWNDKLNGKLQVDNKLQVDRLKVDKKLKVHTKKKEISTNMNDLVEVNIARSEMNNTKLVSTEAKVSNNNVTDIVSKDNANGHRYHPKKNNTVDKQFINAKELGLRVGKHVRNADKSGGVDKHGFKCGPTPGFTVKFEKESTKNEVEDGKINIGRNGVYLYDKSTNRYSNQ